MRSRSQGVSFGREYGTSQSVTIWTLPIYGATSGDIGVSDGAMDACICWLVGFMNGRRGWGPESCGTRNCETMYPQQPPCVVAQKSSCAVGAK